MLLPLVLEHFGRWGKDVEDFLSKLALQSRDTREKKNVTEFKALWRQMMSVTLQKSNSQVIRDKIKQLRHHLSNHSWSFTQ